MAQHSNGRGGDPVFLPGEKLFRRHERDHLLGDGTLDAMTLGSSPCSVNREKYSDSPQCVLHPDCCEGKDCREWGISEVSVAQVEGLQMLDGKGMQRKMTLVHRPCETCYPHSEIWYTSADNDIPSEHCPDSARRHLRALLAMTFSRLKDNDSVS